MANDNDIERFDDSRRPWLAMAGLAVGVIGWLVMVFLPKVENTGTLKLQLYLVVGIAAIGLLLSFFGRKRSFGLAVMGMIVSAMLMLMMIISAIVIVAD